AVLVYVLVAGGAANLLTAWFSTDSDLADFALGHFPPLILLIAAGIVFVRFSGWSRYVWRTPASFETRPRRWWMLAFPVLLLAQSIILLTLVPWAGWDVGAVLVVAAGTALVGIGEELYFRGILRASLRSHHGETLALVVTSLLFGLGHSLGSVMNGLDGGFIVFQVGVTALDGAILYGAFRATGRLWVPMVLHAFSDFTLYLANNDLADKTGSEISTSPANTAIESVLWVLAIVLLISCIRQDLRTRREQHATPAPA
ncbi:CPBP family intramembrane glutamic endopeptidase, partial [Agromyces salentinus]|uniref:CPBP family intramembrane glutamic endopeptidase n=1 Tax=Agromyces salentinus TaxID=269421 RepID=UPI0012FA9CEF